VSDRKQAEEDISVPAQIEHAERMAHTLGAAVLRVFTDEGKSAFRAANRKTFETAIEFAVLSEATYFITWSSSRFARNQIESVFFKRELDRAGVKLKYVSMNIDRETDEGWLADGICAMFDELQSRQNSKDTRRSMIRNAQQGFWHGGYVPLGYESAPAPENEKRRKLQIVDAEAPIVRRIFASRVQGFGAKAIAEELNRVGLSHRGRAWCKAAVLRILRNEAYIGTLVFNRTDRRTGKPRPRDQWIIVPSHAAIVDVETWNAVQQQMNNAAERCEGSPLSRHAFTGLLRCGECGASLQIETARGRSRQYAYYNCRANQQGGQCRARRIRADLMDTWLNQIILDRVLSRENLIGIARALEESSREQLGNRDQARRELHAEAQQLRTRNGKLYDLLELHGRDAPNLGDMTERLRTNNARLKSIELELADLDRRTEQRLALTEREIDILGDSLRDLLMEPEHAAKARQFYGSFIASITMRDRTAEIRYDPAKLLPAASPVHSKAIWLPGRSMLRTGCGSVTGSAVRVLVCDLPAKFARAA
jgi:site-specific DNA recombinase